VIHQVQPALGQPLFVYINSMVILGKEPVIVDTGTPANRKQWLDDVFSLVEPEDVRWIFLSHDDVDHTGNLDEALTARPNARWCATGRWSNVSRQLFSFAARNSANAERLGAALVDDASIYEVVTSGRE
jgi:flavorubredoxin